MKKERIKKILIIVGIIILLAGIIWTITSCQKKETTAKQQESIQIQSVINQVSQLIGYPYLIQEKNKIVFYQGKKQGNDFYFSQIDLSSQKTQKIKDYSYLGISDIAYSRDTSKIYIHREWPYQSGVITNEILDLTNNQTYDLNSNIEQSVFMPDNKILYTYYDSDLDANKLDVANLDGGNWQEYVDAKKIPFRKFSIITDQQGENIILINDFHDLTDKFGFVYINKNKEIRQIAKEKLVTSASFSPDSTKILFETREGKYNLLPHLYIYDLGENKEYDLQIASFVRKTGWFDNDDLFVAIPIEIPEDYNWNNFYSQDELYKIDVTDGKKLIQYYSGEQKVFESFHDIMIDNQQGKIYYLNNDILYEISKKEKE